LKKEIKPPFKPRVLGEEDISNIDRVFTREPPQETPESGQASKLHVDMKFDNFTYYEDSLQDQQSYI